MIRKISFTLLLLSLLLSLQAQKASSISIEYIHVPSPPYAQKVQSVTAPTSLSCRLFSIIVSETLELELASTDADLQVEISDAQSVIVFQQQLSKNHEGIISLNIEHLTHGAYTLQIRSDEQVFRKKIVKT